LNSVKFPGQSTEVDNGARGTIIRPAPEGCPMEPATLSADTLTIIATVIGVGLALAGMMLRITGRMDRRMDRFDDAMAAHRQAMQDSMDTFRTEMRRIAERQSHIEGRIDERASAGAD